MSESRLGGCIWSRFYFGTMAPHDASSIKMANDHDIDFSILFAVCRSQQKEIAELKERLDEDC